uniref:Uncharacterized protein n=1 Tax=Magnetococcus massalia (strain MO-1) TaxID=451514 RepID=A0A1S7LIK2_MAGMO|nr:protein of unknown function [Candidatus Magnetococcus massalia]
MGEQLANNMATAANPKPLPNSEWCIKVPSRLLRKVPLPAGSVCKQIKPHLPATLKDHTVTFNELVAL